MYENILAFFQMKDDQKKSVLTIIGLTTVIPTPVPFSSCLSPQRIPTLQILMHNKMQFQADQNWQQLMQH